MGSIVSTNTAKFVGASSKEHPQHALKSTDNRQVRLYY